MRFFGGIENTHFGQVCYEADWLMKRISFALEQVPVQGLETYYDLAVKQVRQASNTSTLISSRFWFYSIVSRVNVVGDVVLLEKMQMGVFIGRSAVGWGEQHNPQQVPSLGHWLQSESLDP